MKNSKKIFLLMEAGLAVLAILTALAMFRERNGQPRGRVSVIIQDSDNSQWSAFKYGLRMAAEDLELEMFVVSTSGQMSGEEEEELIQWEMDNGVDAVIVQPVPGEEAGQMLARMEKSVPMMLVECGPASEEEGAIPVTGPDQKAMGQTLARELLADYGGDIHGKTMGIISQNKESEAVRLRAEGFRSVLAEAGGTVCWSISEYGEESGGILEEQEEVDFVIALDNASLIKAGNACAKNDLHGALVYGIGNSTEAIYYLDSGSAQCLVVPDEFNMGYQSLAEVAESLGMFRVDMESRTVSHTVIRREDLFTEENQEILFTMNQ